MRKIGVPQGKDRGRGKGSAESLKISVASGTTCGIKPGLVESRTSAAECKGKNNGENSVKGFV